MSREPIRVKWSSDFRPAHIPNRHGGLDRAEPRGELWPNQHERGSGGLPLSDQALPDIHVPSGWAKNAQSAVLHVVSLAHYAIVAARGWAASKINARVAEVASDVNLK